MQKLFEALSMVFGVVAIAFGIIIGSVVLDGLVLMKIWGWFAVPIFGLPALRSFRQSESES